MSSTASDRAAERERWIADNFGGYRPLLAYLRSEFGAEFDVQHTGGGCFAIIGVLGSGHEVWLTMAVDVLGTYAEHVSLEAEGELAGWGVGIYGAANDHSEALAWVGDEHMPIHDLAGVAQLVRDALARVPAAVAGAGDRSGGPSRDRANARPKADPRDDCSRPFECGFWTNDNRE